MSAEEERIQAELGLYPGILADLDGNYRLWFSEEIVRSLLRENHRLNDMIDADMARREASP
jgi:hypothetical protein